MSKFTKLLRRGFQISCGKNVKYRFIEFFVFDYDSRLYLLSLFFWSGITFSVVALHKIVHVLHLPCCSCCVYGLSRKFFAR